MIVVDKNQKKSKRNYGSRVKGPWVFGFVVEKISDIDAQKTINASNAALKKQLIRQFSEKSKWRMLYKDNRLLNTAQNREHKGRRYVSKIIPKNIYQNISKYCIS